MAYLPETATWDDGVYQIETTDPVLGGPNGTSNQPLKNLANRTAYLKQQLGVVTPPGIVAHFARNSAPTGWLKANGATISRTTYAGLFAAIGTAFGAGDGLTTFKLPDLRGEFLRGWDDGRGADAGRAFGSFQVDDFKSHVHGGFEEAGFDNGGVGSQPRLTFDDGIPFEGTVQNMTSGGSNETRPRNVALLACIKY